MWVNRMSEKQNRIKEEIECCSEKNIGKVAKTRIEEIAEDDTESIEMLASFFSVFSDPTRLRIIKALIKEELCVCDIANLLSLKQPCVSQQLSTLWKARIVKRRKEGNQVFYRLEDEHIERIYKMGEEHIYE